MPWKFIKPYKKILFNLSNNLLKELLLVAIYIFIIEILRNIFQTIMQKISNKYVIKVETDIQTKMFEEILKIEIQEFDKNTTEHFIDRITNDSTHIISIFSILTKTFIDFISNIGILFVVFYINKYIFIYFLITALIINLIDKKRRNLTYELNKKYKKKHETKTSLITEIIRGIKDVKLLNANNNILKIVKKRLSNINNEREKKIT